MTQSIGTDILSIKKLESIFSRPDYLQDAFIRRTFTEKEIELSATRPLPLYFFATRFAGKEAVFKALNLQGDDVRFLEIEILSDEIGKPYVTLYGMTKETAAGRGIRQILLSLSYEDDYALAFAVATS